VKEAVKDAAAQVQAKCVEAKNFLQGTGKESTLSPAEMAQKKLEEMVKSMFAVDTLESLGSLSGFIIDIIVPACAEQARCGDSRRLRWCGSGRLGSGSSHNPSGWAPNAANPPKENGCVATASACLCLVPLVLLRRRMRLESVSAQYQNGDWPNSSRC